MHQEFRESDYNSKLSETNIDSEYFVILPDEVEEQFIETTAKITHIIDSYVAKHSTTDGLVIISLERSAGIPVAGLEHYFAKRGYTIPVIPVRLGRKHLTDIPHTASFNDEQLLYSEKAKTDKESSKYSRFIDKLTKLKIKTILQLTGTQQVIQEKSSQLTDELEKYNVKEVIILDDTVQFGNTMVASHFVISEALQHLDEPKQSYFLRESMQALTKNQKQSEDTINISFQEFFSNPDWLFEIINLNYSTFFDMLGELKSVRFSAEEIDMVRSFFFYIAKGKAPHNSLAQFFTKYQLETESNDFKNDYLRKHNPRYFEQQHPSTFLHHPLEMIEKCIAEYPSVFSLEELQYLPRSIRTSFKLLLET